MKIVFMGTPDFGLVVLDYLHRHHELLVVTRPDKKVGRKQIIQRSPVKDWALLHKVRMLQPEGVINIFKELEEFAPDVIITAAFGEFIPQKILDLARIIPINIHASLLPKYRGGAPIHKSIINGDKEAGITIIKMVKKMDAGEIIAQRKILIAFNDTATTLTSRLAVLARDLLIAVLPTLESGTYTLCKQDERAVTFAYNITHEEQWINWDKQAKEIDNHIRGLSDQPGALTAFNGVIYRIAGATVVPDLTPVAAGTIISSNKDLIIKAKKDAIKVVSIQQAGKKMMGIKDFLNGNKALMPGLSMQKCFDEKDISIIKKNDIIN